MRLRFLDQSDGYRLKCTMNICGNSQISNFRFFSVERLQPEHLYPSPRKCSPSRNSSRQSFIEHCRIGGIGMLMMTKGSKQTDLYGHERQSVIDLNKP